MDPGSLRQHEYEPWDGERAIVDTARL